MLSIFFTRSESGTAIRVRTSRMDLVDRDAIAPLAAVLLHPSTARVRKGADVAAVLEMGGI